MKSLQHEPASDEHFHEVTSFNRLPAFAAFLMEHHFEDYIREQLRLSRLVKLPMLRFFEHMTENALVEMSKAPHGEILSYLAENRAAELIEISLQRWANDQIDWVARDGVAAEDITLGSYVRKTAMLRFAPSFFSDTAALLELVREIDTFSRVNDTLALATYEKILNRRLNDQRHFRELVAQTTPGIVFIYNYADRSEVYANRNLHAMLGYTEDEIRAFGPEALAAILHPDDSPRAFEHIAAMGRMTDEQTLQNEYRVKDKAGRFRWMRTYESVFARNADGTPSQIIGVAFDVDAEKETLTKLHESEALHRQAQALALIGSWRYEVDTQAVTWSDELYRIYEVPTDPPVDLERAMRFTHPDDATNAATGLQRAIESGQPYVMRYRIVTPTGKLKTLINRANVFTGKDGRATHVIGSIQDITEHQRLVEQLEESQRLYQQAQALAHIGNWTYDLANDDLQLSDELYRIFGIAPTEPVDYGRFLAIFHPDDREPFRQRMHEALEKDGSFNFTSRILSADGQLKYIEQRGEWKKNADGTAGRVFGTVQDVTLQHLVESQLRDNQTFIQKIADATPSIITSYNVRTGNYLYVSGGLNKLLGYDPSVPLNEGTGFFVSLMHPDDFEAVMKENALALQRANRPGHNGDDRMVTEFTYRMRHADGRYRWFHTYGTVFARDANGLVESILNISLDITERMETEHRLKERERFITHIADASPTVLYLYDLASHRVVYANEEVRYALGYEPQELLAIGNLFTPALFHPEDILKTPDHNYTDAGAEVMVQYECRMKHKADRWRWMLMREVVYQRDAAGMPLQVLSAALDITERKSMERSLTQKTTELQQTNANLAEFAYVASHDLKEPLRKIQVFSDRIASKEAVRLSDTGKDWFRRMQSAAARMDKLIDDLLSFSRTNTNEKSPEPTDLNKLLATIKNDLSEQIERSKARIEARDLPTLNVVPIQFRQLMQNLISNAIKFHKLDEAPLIRITADTVPGNETNHPAADKGKLYMKLSFADNGIGFEPEYADRIFGLFQRLHGKGEYPGTGIGLALCKKVAENHDGFIVAEGKPGEGATFNVFLPAQ